MVPVGHGVLDLMRMTAERLAGTLDRAVISDLVATLRAPVAHGVLVLMRMTTERRAETSERVVISALVAISRGAQASAGDRMCVVTSRRVGTSGLAMTSEIAATLVRVASPGRATVSRGRSRGVSAADRTAATIGTIPRAEAGPRAAAGWAGATRAPSDQSRSITGNCLPMSGMA